MSALSGHVSCRTLIDMNAYNRSVRYAYADGEQLFDSNTHKAICGITDLISGDDYDRYGLEVRCELYGYMLE